LEREKIEEEWAVRYRVETIVGKHFRRWIRVWGACCEVLEPVWLREEQRREALALLALLDGAGSASSAAKEE
jgi:hypothetical protein